VIDVSRELLAELENTLATASVPDAAAEALQIVHAALGQAASGDYATRARDMATARARGAPLAYLTRQASFMGVDVFVAPGALIPRISCNDQRGALLPLVELVSTAGLAHPEAGAAVG